MHKEPIVPISERIRETARLNGAEYARLRDAAYENPDAFWKAQADIVDWVKPPTKICSARFLPPVSIKWFEDGALNVAYNCLDRHLKTRGNKTAIFWESDDGKTTRKISYREAYEETCRLACALLEKGVKKGSRVTIYMPMIPEAIFAMLACARIGAPHSVVFAGFSPKSLRSRIQDCGSSVVITADEGLRGGKIVPLKKNVDAAIEGLSEIQSVIVAKRTGNPVEWTVGRDCWMHEIIEGVAPESPPEVMNAEDPLFILYTSGSTGNPKGLLHTSGGYLVWASLTHQYVFDSHEDDVYFCTADVGWITGHTYLVYGPLANGATTVMFEGVPNFPDPSRLWRIVDKFNVSIFYTAPTAIRALMREGDAYVKSSSRRSLRILGSVGEPINPEAWRWYHDVIGDGRCAVVDTWWQTETGGIMIAPVPGALAPKPGSATLPFFGVSPLILSNDGAVLSGACEGNLCLSKSWPGQARTIYGDHARFEQTYFSNYAGYYFTGDGAARDEDGYYWITGRVDDVINVAGHRLGSAEIESALVAHESVAEAAVIGFPHNIKGEGLYAFVILKVGVSGDAALEKALIEHVRADVSPIAKPDYIQFTGNLPKTRSGKIMRRILRKIAANQIDEIGDVSTLADPSILESLLKNRKEVNSGC